LEQPPALQAALFTSTLRNITNVTPWFPERPGGAFTADWSIELGLPGLRWRVTFGPSGKGFNFNT
jgi:hypothetical protein